MKASCLLVLLATALLSQAATDKTWIEATLAETATQRQNLGWVSNGGTTAVWGGYGAAAQSYGMTSQVSGLVYGYRLETETMTFLVACAAGLHTPVVTVNGRVKYAYDKGEFYMLDEVGITFHMRVLQKTAKSQAPPPPCLIVKHKGTLGKRILFTALIGVPIAPGANYQLVDSLALKGIKIEYKGRELENLQAAGVRVIILQHNHTSQDVADARASCSAK